MDERDSVEQLETTVMSKLHDGIEGWNSYHQANSEAVWFVCNSLAYSLAGEEIEFLSGLVHSRESGKIEIAAYTPTYLIYFNGVPGTSGPAYTIIPRTQLSRLEVRGAPAVIPPRRMEQRESTGSYAVEYGDSTKFTIPVAPNHYHRDIDKFLRSLWPDLVK